MHTDRPDKVDQPPSENSSSSSSLRAVAGRAFLIGAVLLAWELIRPVEVVRFRPQRAKSSAIGPACAPPPLPDEALARENSQLHRDVASASDRWRRVCAGSPAAGRSFDVAETEPRPSCPVRFTASFAPELNSMFLPQYPHDEGRELQNAPCYDRMVQWSRRSDHDQALAALSGWGSPSDAIPGFLIATNGKRDIWTDRHPSIIRGHDRINDVIRLVRPLRQVTMVFINIHDVDVWSLVRGPAYDQRRKDLQAILAECPLFLLHWNPTADPDTGRLPPRTFPIPDYFRLTDWVRPRFPPTTPGAPQPRSLRLFWRGRTLGGTLNRSDTFYSSDRARSVSGFATVSRWCAAVSTCNARRGCKWSWEQASCTLSSATNSTNSSAVDTTSEVNCNMTTGMSRSLGASDTNPSPAIAPACAALSLDVRFSGLANGVTESEAIAAGPLAFPPHLAADPPPQADPAEDVLLLDVDGHCSSWEGLRWKLASGKVVLKALSTAGNVQWYYPLLADGQELVLFDPRRQTADWLNRVQTILSNATRRSEMVRRADAFARQHFTDDAVEEYLEQLVSRLWEREAEWRTRDWRIQGSAALRQGH